MAWGKEEFRTKYKESNDCLKKIKDNYYDLDYEYQMTAKELQQKENIIKEVREFVEKWKEVDGDGTVSFDINTNPDDLLRILDKGE